MVLNTDLSFEYLIVLWKTQYILFSPNQSLGMYVYVCSHFRD